MKKLTAFFSATAMVFSLAGALPVAADAAVLPLSSLKSGDLVRGTTFPAVYYYGKDGFRYVFPNDKTYFTWYSDFSTVKWVSDADLSKIQIGGNVTYRPGVRMIKINTDPKAYAIDAGGTLRWVATEAIAKEIYGANWNKMIDDMPDAFFGNYKKGGENVDGLSNYTPATVTATASTINDDKKLQNALVITIQDGSFEPSLATISKGRAVRFVNAGTVDHSATAQDLNWGTGTMKNGDTFSRYFKDAGTFDYFCSYHPDTMSGKIIVQ